MERKHNPVLNGTTKKAIFGVTISLAILTLVIIIGLIIVIMEDLDTFKAWKAETTLGTLAGSGMSILGGAVVKFMNTRSDMERDQYRLAKLDRMNLKKDNHLKYKLEKYKINKLKKG